jgi:translation initiation factor 4G
MLLSPPRCPPFQDEATPRAEDIECLCKLLSTVGLKLDSTTKSEFQDRMGVYFDRMRRLTDNQLLESRIRFMVQDVLDMRGRQWRPRQKVEGPKKISEVHQDAQRQLQQQEQRDREERRGGGGGRRLDSQGSRGGYDSRMSRDEAPSRPLSSQRPQGSEPNLRPSASGGAFGRGGKSSGGGGASDSLAAAGSRAPDRLAPQGSTPLSEGGEADEGAVSEPATPKEGGPLAADKLNLKASSLVEEYWVGTSLPDAIANLKDMRAAGADMPRAVVAVVVAALNHRGIAVGERLPPFVAVLEAALQEGELQPEELRQGALVLGKQMHNLTEDLPKVRGGEGERKG